VLLPIATYSFGPQFTVSRLACVKVVYFLCSFLTAVQEVDLLLLQVLDSCEVDRLAGSRHTIASVTSVIRQLVLVDDSGLCLNFFRVTTSHLVKVKECGLVGEC
jgi:hypothetical protein